MFGSRRPPDRLDARAAAADANADAASTGERLSRITAIRARGSGGDSNTFRSLTPNAPGAKWSLRFGAPLPRFGHAIWMDPSMSYRRSPKMELFVAKIAAAGSWAAYEKAHTTRLVPVFEKIFPRLPPDVVPTIVAFGFHTGYY